PEHALDGQSKSMLLVHRGHVIEAIEIRNGLQVGLVLDQLLGAAVQKAHMGVNAFHEFAVELENQAQHAVSRWVNRPEVDGEIAYVDFRQQFFGFSSPGST